MKVHFEVARLTRGRAAIPLDRLGWDQVEYRIATNPGEPLKPLTKSPPAAKCRASCWPSRSASKRASSSRRRRPPPLAPWSSTRSTSASAGRAADAVGQKLKSLSRGQQVLCVTHLPQIASFADQHFVVEKHESGGRTKMQIRLLDDRARTHEVARMLSGATVTETSLQHAAQMIAASR